VKKGGNCSNLERYEEKKRRGGSTSKDQKKERSNRRECRRKNNVRFRKREGPTGGGGGGQAARKGEARVSKIWEGRRGGGPRDLCRAQKTNSHERGGGAAVWKT